MFWRFTYSAVLCLSSVAIPASAAVVYNEAISGDLSNSGLTPTMVALATGSNEISGATGRPGAAVDTDYFTVTIPSGFLLTSIVVLPGTSIAGPVSFIGVQAGSQVTLPANTTTAAGLLGWTHYSAAGIGTDILDDLGIPANGSTGFSPPLTAGAYSFWIQEFGAGTFPYAFDLTVTPVPEPGTWASVLAGLAVVASALRRRR